MINITERHNKIVQVRSTWKQARGFEFSPQSKGDLNSFFVKFILVGDLKMEKKIFSIL